MKGKTRMKHVQKVAAWILTIAAVLAMSVSTVLAGDIMPYATNAHFSMKPPVIDQTVADVNSTIQVIIPAGAQEAGFEIKKVYWVPDATLPVPLPNGNVMGRIEMGEQGLERDGQPVATMNDSDVFLGNKQYLVLYEVASTKGILSDASEIHLNGQDMVYEGFADAEHTGVTILYAAEFTAADKEQPQAVFAATGYSSGVLGNINSSMQYSIDGSNWINCGDERITLSGISEGTIEVRYINSPVNVQTIYIGRKSVPDGVTVKGCTTLENNDGEINGVNPNMEYRMESVSEYITVPGYRIGSLTPGTFCIRSKADGNELASGEIEVTVTEHSAGVPKITTQPQNVKIETGKDAKFTIEATGEGLTYEWHYIDYKKQKEKVIENDSKYFKGQGTKSIQVLSVNNMHTDEVDCEYDKDQFYCIVSNPAGSVVSNVVTYNVTHVAGKEWKNDSKSHWQLCVCGVALNKADHVDANKDGKCDVCGYNLSNSKVYRIISGQDSKWVKGSSAELKFGCDGKSENFKEVQVDGKTLKSNEYGCITDEKTKTLIISLPAEYLEKLSANVHSVTLKFSDGSATTQFTVDDNSSKDPDPVPSPSQMTTLTWILLAVGIVAVIVIIILLISIIKGKKSRK